MRVALVNIGTIVSGDLNAPLADGDTIITEGERIVTVGTASASEVDACDVVIDAGGATAIPGLIDLTCTSPSATSRRADGRLPGKLPARRSDHRDQRVGGPRPRAAARCRRGEGARRRRAQMLRALPARGMRVHAGSVILEPTLNGNDLGEIAKKGVWLAKAGFGAFKTAFEYGPLVAAARAHGMITTCHTGGSSIPGSGAITGDHLLAMKPHVSFHVNGGPTAMPDKDFERIIVEGDMALQVCTAGNCAPRCCARHSRAATTSSIA